MNSLSSSLGMENCYLLILCTRSRNSMVGIIEVILLVGKIVNCSSY